MKKKILASLFTAILVFTGLPNSAMDMTSVQAAEVESAYYTSGVVTDENGNKEICVGDYLEVSAVCIERLMIQQLVQNGGVFILIR